MTVEAISGRSIFTASRNRSGCPPLCFNIVITNRHTAPRHFKSRSRCDFQSGDDRSQPRFDLNRDGHSWCGDIGIGASGSPGRLVLQGGEILLLIEFYELSHGISSLLELMRWQSKCRAWLTKPCGSFIAT